MEQKEIKKQHSSFCKIKLGVIKRNFDCVKSQIYKPNIGYLNF